VAALSHRYKIVRSQSPFSSPQGQGVVYSGVFAPRKQGAPVIGAGPCGLESVNGGVWRLSFEMGATDGGHLR